MWSSVEGEGDYRVSLYFRPGVRSTIVSRHEVLNNAAYTRVQTPHRQIDGDTLTAWFDLENVSVATQINYLIRLESSRGNFSMINITYERSSRPELVSE